MVVTANQVKELREKSGAGIMECKRALEQVQGDITKAVELLKQQGLVEPYIHGAGRIGSIVEVNCETDFVARTPDFRELAHDLAMQVAATSPAYVSINEVPESAWAELEKEHGDREKAAAAVILLEQPFIKDPKLSIRDLVRERIGKLGENIVVRRFARFEVGADNSPASVE